MQGRGTVKNVALYARVSSEQQAQQATVKSQIAMLQERAKADGHVVLPSDIHVDEGYSGATLVRPALERLRDRAADGGIDVLYVHNPDRLARRYAYQVLLLEELSRHGVSVVFLQGPVGRSAEDELLVQVQGMIAEYERAKIMERCRRGKLHKARSGIANALSGAPYGYLYVRKTDEEPARYQVLLHEAKVVRSIFQWLVEEQVSIGEITRRLRAQGSPTRTGKNHWDRSVVWAILRNPAYAGQAAFGKTESVPRGQLLRPIRTKSPTPRRAKSGHRDKPASEWISIPVPAIVSPEMFAAANEQLERNRRLSARNARGQLYLLQGLVVCARCGYAFYGKRVSQAAAKDKPRRYAYYRCVGNDGYRFAGGRVCRNPQVRVDQLDGYVWESVLRTMEDPGHVLEEWSQRGARDGTVAELRTQRDEAKRLLVAQEHTLRRLRDAYEAGAVDLEDLVARSERVRARIQRARKELDEAETQLKQTIELTAVVGRLTEFADRVRVGLHRLDWQQRRQLIRTLVARVELDEDGATVIYRVPTPTSPPAGGQPANGGSGNESCQLRWGRDDSALRRTSRVSLRRSTVSLIDDGRFEKHLHQRQHGAVNDPLRHDLHQPIVWNCVEVGGHIGIQDPAHPLGERCVNRIQRLMRRLLRPEPVGVAVEVRFEERLEQQLRRHLHHAVTDVGNPQRPLSAAELRDVHAPYRSGPVRLRLQLLVQVFQQHRASVHLDVLEGAAIGTCRAAVRPDQRVGVCEHVPPVDLVVQRVCPKARVLLGAEP